MIKHIVMWTMKENGETSKKRNAEILKEKLEELKLKIPFIRNLEVGINFKEDEAAFDVVLYSEFDSKEDLEKYTLHPDHQALKDFIVNVREKRVFVDYEV